MSIQRTVRTHTCGDLRPSHAGQTVELCGWVAKRRDHGGLVFIDLRDRYGITQIVFDPAVNPEAHAKAGALRSEFVLWARGKVRARPEGMTNTKISTGGIEVAMEALVILSEAKTPPFVIPSGDDEVPDVAETIRLKYRYLDLRRPQLQKHLLTRAKMISIARAHLESHQFVEVETPILYKSTPEGARDFVVPSRVNPGTFYALPQSPQTLKQLLMVSGMDRYYQVARCFRDEDLRADRQPEFSQIDIEASFLDEEAFFPILEVMMAKIWKELMGVELKTPFPRMSYHTAMSRYGSDKPDIRFGLEMQDLSMVFEKSEFQVFAQALKQPARGERGGVRAIKIEGKAEVFSRKHLDDLHAHAVTLGAKGLLWIKVQEGGELQSPAAKFFSETEKKALASALSLKAGDLVLMVADPNAKVACEALGGVRLKAGAQLGLVPPPGEGAPAFLWVMDFPLIEFDEKENRYFALHHPFTAPKPECVDDFVAGRNLDTIRACAYDLVLNGVEIGGGSLRIYRQEVQAAMFKHLGLTLDEAKSKFGFFLEGLEYGTPPHGGIAFGVDRLAMILCGTHAIRDVMAFPKTQKGTCLMSESPSKVTPEQLAELAISVRTP